MAIAYVAGPFEITAEGTVYHIRGEPFDAEPFAGPPDRDWDAFRLTEHGAEYQWRTGADVVRAAAQAVVAGQLVVVKARAIPAVRAWLDKRLDTFLEVAEEAAGLTTAACEEQMLREVGSGIWDLTGIDEPFSFYDYDDDECLADAARALELPPWAEIVDRLEGGPGNSFTAWSLVLEPGKTLEDLAEWMSQPSGGGRRR